MRICFDLRALQIGHENRGIGMHIRSILEHIHDDDNEYVFYAFEGGDPVADLKIAFKPDYELITTPKLNTQISSPSDILHLLKLTFHRFSTLRANKPDMFVQFDFMLGVPSFRQTKKVMIAYDLIPMLMKNEYMPSLSFAWNHSAGKKAKLRAISRSLYYRLKYRLHYRAFMKADQLISISDATKQSFITYLGVPADKITTIPLAPVLTKERDTRITDTIKQPYIFYVGGTDSRKRIVDVVRAFHIIRSRGVYMQLVLAGNEFKKLEQLPDVPGRNAILDSPFKQDIHLVGFVTDAQKVSLYEHAHAFVFCSIFEGFGLPVIEAMASGCPVVSYNNSSIPEAAGNAAILVETGDYVSVAKACIDLREDKLRKEIQKKGLAQAKKFTWQSYVRDLDNALSK